MIVDNFVSTNSVAPVWLNQRGSVLNTGRVPTTATTSHQPTQLLHLSWCANCNEAEPPSASLPCKVQPAKSKPSLAACFPSSAQGQEQWGQQLVEDMAIVYEKKMLSQAHQKHTLGGGGGGKPPSLSSQQLGRVGSSLEAGKSPSSLPGPDGGG